MGNDKMAAKKMMPKKGKVRMEVKDGYVDRKVSNAKVSKPMAKKKSSEDKEGF